MITFAECLELGEDGRHILFRMTEILIMVIFADWKLFVSCGFCKTTSCFAHKLQFYSEQLETLKQVAAAHYKYVTARSETSGEFNLFSVCVGHPQLFWMAQRDLLKVHLENVHRTSNGDVDLDRIRKFICCIQFSLVATCFFSKLAQLNRGQASKVIRDRTVEEMWKLRIPLDSNFADDRFVYL